SKKAMAPLSAMRKLCRSPERAIRAANFSCSIWPSRVRPPLVQPVEQINVVIAFYSRYCATEKLALSVGLGVLQARATPRFRRIPDLAPPAVIDVDPEWTKNLARMKIEYVAPRPGDPKLADVLVLVTPGDETTEVLEFVKSLAKDGSLKGKIAAPVC